MEPFHVRTAQLGSLADELVASADALTLTKETLEDSAQQLYWDWQGEGADAFHRRVDLLSADLDHRTAALTQAAQAARQLEDLYARADVNLARLFGGE